MTKITSKLAAQSLDFSPTPAEPVAAGHINPRRNYYTQPLYPMGNSISLEKGKTNHGIEVAQNRLTADLKVHFYMFTSVKWDLVNVYASICLASNKKN
ncbi:hypothetical protein AVEN_40226-1 [Araneus ventricosus]|uniref:Uncharacterized protein n=1 Tax=Araneus ventricosus TaxID=182803 RepID=A0A4Y2LM24_ARAVE|nr:hypothetical protein AVEN_40226-1 [Araneus ventricosus]